MSLKFKLKKLSNPHKTKLEKLKEDYKVAALNLQKFQEEHTEFFDEFQSLCEATETAADQLKMEVRLPFVGKPKGSHNVIDDPDMLVTANVIYSAPDYDPYEVLEILGVDRVAELKLLQQVVDHKALEKAIADGLVDDSELEGALVAGSQKTTQVSIKFKQKEK